MVFRGFLKQSSLIQLISHSSCFLRFLILTNSLWRVQMFQRSIIGVTGSCWRFPYPSSWYDAAVCRFRNLCQSNIIVRWCPRYFINFNNCIPSASFPGGTVFISSCPIFIHLLFSITIIPFSGNRSFIYATTFEFHMKFGTPFFWVKSSGHFLFLNLISHRCYGFMVFGFPFFSFSMP